MSRLVRAVLFLTAWGALAFGAVYPWAFWPLFAGCALVGIFAVRAGARLQRPPKALVLSLVLLLAVIALQLVPFPRSVIRSVTPNTDTFLQDYEVGYGVTGSAHALSISSRDTGIALAAAASLAILLVGLVSALTRDEARAAVRGLSGLGGLLALAGIIQKALWNGKIYGFWTPLEGGLSFGPFVNRNHFAGWMLMAMPVCVGYFCGRVSQGMRRVRPTWRSRLLWFSSQDASETILVGFAVILMALSLLLSMSRSGLLGLAAAVMLCGIFIARRTRSLFSRMAIVAYVAVILAVVVGRGDIDRFATRFAEHDAGTFGNRLGVWTDTWHIARRFPVTGSGLNTYGISMLYYQTTELNKHYAQAHNDYLQLLAEGGLLVCIPAALVVIALVWIGRREFVQSSAEDTWIRIGAATGLVAVAMQEAGDFSLQMPGNAVLFVVVLALAIRPSRR